MYFLKGCHFLRCQLLWHLTNCKIWKKKYCWRLSILNSQAFIPLEQLRSPIYSNICFYFECEFISCSKYWHFTCFFMLSNLRIRVKNKISSHQRRSMKKLLLNVSQYSQKKILHHRCFPVNIPKFLRTPILKSICEWLPLNQDVPLDFFLVISLGNQSKTEMEM